MSGVSMAGLRLLSSTALDACSVWVVQPASMAAKESAVKYLIMCSAALVDEGPDLHVASCQAFEKGFWLRGFLLFVSLAICTLDQSSIACMRGSQKVTQPSFS